MTTKKSEVTNGNPAETTGPHHEAGLRSEDEGMTGWRKERGEALLARGANTPLVGSVAVDTENMDANVSRLVPVGGRTESL